MLHLAMVLLVVLIVLIVVLVVIVVLIVLIVLIVVLHDHAKVVAIAIVIVRLARGSASAAMKGSLFQHLQYQCPSPPHPTT